jgi:hypothetical protein
MVATKKCKYHASFMDQPIEVVGALQQKGVFGCASESYAPRLLQTTLRLLDHSLVG